LLLVLLAGLLHWWVLALLLVFNVGAGMTSPAALTRTLSVHPELVGSAAGLYGAIQMVVGAVCTSAVGLGQDPALAMAGVLIVAGAISQFGFRDALRRAPAH
jgi:DHA1 family bicyclomycin/chloramphenicol resistance-like MFS transporter